MMKTHNCLALVFFCLALSIAEAQKLKSPESFFGHQMGAEGQIIDYFDGLKYYKELAQQSDKIQYTELGKTTDGNPFVLIFISSPRLSRSPSKLK